MRGMGNMKLQGSMESTRKACRLQRRADMVYGNGLRRYLIIFDPHTLVLDRRRGPGQAPSPQLVQARSKNFTSGLANTQHAEHSHQFRSAHAGAIGGASTPRQVAADTRCIARDGLKDTADEESIQSIPSYSMQDHSAEIPKGFRSL